MALHKFSSELSGSDRNKAPFKISAGKLDGNFKMCSPITQTGETYIKIEQSADGWKLRFAHDKFVKVDQAKIFDVCENGQPVQYVLYGKRVP
jgi:hypothetical protein